MNVLNVELISPPSITVSNKDWKKVKQHMKDGFCVVERHEGSITLEKKPKILLTISCEGGEVKTIDFRNRLVEYYGIELHTNELIENFRNDLKSEKIKIEKCEYGLYILPTNTPA